MVNIDIEYLQQWIGKVESATDFVSPVPVRALRATLDREAITVLPGDQLPPMWHILYFLPLCNQSELAENGHPELGDFMPPIPLPRRMYAGGRIRFHRPLQVGDNMVRKSDIADLSFKQGRSGPLIFLKVKHEVSNDGGLALTEEQDIVYRRQPGSGDPLPGYQAAPANGQWQREMTAGPVLLFRFSALTFNGHRIHYDYPYTTGTGGYPGLVVHGPLLAILLLELLQQQMPNANVKEFRYRAMKPVFAGSPFFLCGAPADDIGGINLWARDADGHVCVAASVMLA